MSGGDERGPQFRARYLPLIVAGITIPIVFAFYLGGAALGAAAGAAMAVTIAVYAARQKPVEDVEVAPLRDLKRHILVVISVPLTDSSAVDEVLHGTAEDGDAPEAEIRVLAPASAGFLDRWASSVGPARDAAQQRLVVTVASLAKAGIDAVARVGDEDLSRRPRISCAPTPRPRSSSSPARRRPMRPASTRSAICGTAWGCRCAG